MATVCVDHAMIKQALNLFVFLAFVNIVILLSMKVALVLKIKR